MSAQVLAIGLLLLAAYPMLSSCRASSGSSDEITADSTHVETIVNLQLADARAEITGEPADSLRKAALALHGLDSTGISTVLDAYVHDPENAVALYERAGEKLTEEQRGR